MAVGRKPTKQNVLLRNVAALSATLLVSPVLVVQAWVWYSMHRNLGNPPQDRSGAFMVQTAHLGTPTPATILSESLADVDTHKNQSLVLAALRGQVERLQGELAGLQSQLALAHAREKLRPDRAEVQFALEPRQVSSNSSTRPYLTICMPTTPRGGRIDYVELVVKALLDQIEEVALLHIASGEAAPKIQLIVMNTRPAPLGNHTAFESARQKFEGHGTRPIFKNASQVEWADPSDFEPNNMANPKMVPGHEVRRQTHDMVQLLGACGADEASRSLMGEFTMLVEDDFLPCPFALHEVINALRLLPACRPKLDWKTVSFSQGMNAIVVPRRGLINLTLYLEQTINVRPPDLLIYDFEWNFGEQRMGYRYHVFEHVGDMSSFAFRQTATFQSKNAKYRSSKCWQDRKNIAIAGYIEAPVIGYNGGALGRFESGQSPPSLQPHNTRPDLLLSPCAGGGASLDSQRSLDTFLHLQEQARQLNTAFLPTDMAVVLHPNLPPLPVAKQHAPWTTLGVGVLSCSDREESLPAPLDKAVRSLSACMESCDQVEGCNSFSYLHTTDTCFLKAGCGRPKKVAPKDCTNDVWQTYFYEPCLADAR